MVNIPNPHRQPGPSRTLWEIGPPIQVVIMYGEVANDNMRARFFNAEVSEIKTVKQ
jgi:hypothetical protein